MTYKANKLMKVCSYIVLFAAIFLLSSLLLPLQSRAAADTTPPKITSISMDKTVAHVGDTVTFSVTIEEEESGVSFIHLMMEHTARTPFFPYGAGFLEQSLTPDTELYTGTYQISRVITEDDAPGTYYLNQAWISDEINNQIKYYNYVEESSETESLFRDEENENQFTVPKSMQLTIINDDYDDYLEQPSASIKSIEIKKHEIQYNETLPVDVLFEGEVPDTFKVNIEFTGEGLSAGANTYELAKDDCQHDGMLYHLNLKMEEDNYSPLRTGSYRVHVVYLSEKGKDLSYDYHYQFDENGDLRFMDRLSGKVCELLGDIHLDITEDPNKDRTKPVIEAVTVQQDQVTRPGVVTVDFTVSDETGIGSTNVYLSKNGYAIQSGGSLSALVNEEEIKPKEQSGQLKLFIPRLTPLGSCQLVIATRDSAGNETQYSTDIEIIEEFDIAFTYGINNANLLQKIRDLKENETGFIKVGYGKINAKKEIFEAIQGRDVNLVFYSDVYEWICNGKDITTPKDITVGLDIFKGDENGVEYLILAFPDNGLLPGKTQMRIESDYLSSIWDVSNYLYLYYVKPDGSLERQNTDVMYIGDGGTENWCYFDITHNSSYYLSGRAMKLSRKVKSIKLSGLSHKILPGKKIQLKATISPSYAKNKKLKWTSSNKKVATVTQKGKVTIKKNTAGKKVTITAKAMDGSGKKATWKITVMKGAVKKITVKGHKKTLKAGKTMQLLADAKLSKAKPYNKNLKWTSSNSKYATVTQFGLVRAKKAGKGKTVTITVMSTDGTNIKVKKKIKIK